VFSRVCGEIASPTDLSGTSQGVEERKSVVTPRPGWSCNDYPRNQNYTAPGVAITLLLLILRVSYGYEL
jgi:hypothetical protein